MSKNKNQNKSNPPASKPEGQSSETDVSVEQTIDAGSEQKTDDEVKTFEKSLTEDQSDDKKVEEASKDVDAEKTAPIAPQPKISQTPEVAFADQTETVTMIFPRPVMLQYEPGKKVTFKAGTREVPAHLADHPYLKSCGVERYKK